MRAVILVLLVAACSDDEPAAGVDASLVIDAALQLTDAAHHDARTFDARTFDAPSLDAGVSSARQTARTLGYQDAPNGFYEYLPPAYDGVRTAPLLIFWHGIGENGNGMTGQLERVLRNGPPRVIDRNAWSADRPFIVLSPQNPGPGCPSAASVRAFLRWAFAHYAVDRDRVYLTGLSCGAIGVWSYLASYLADGEIVAAALVAGSGRSAWNTHGCALGAVGIWAFHGTADETVNPDDQMYSLVGFPTDNRADGSRAESEKVYADWLEAGSPMTGGLIACPAGDRRDARLTLYPGVGHDSWTRTYDLSAGHDLYAWLRSMTR